MLELLRNSMWGAWVVLVLLAVVAVCYYSKRRNERKMVRGLLTFLWSRRVLYSSLYQEHPVAALESVQGIQIRLRDNLERLSSKSQAFWPIREMHEACLGFLTQIEPLTRVDTSLTPGETELISDKWVDGIYGQVFGDALNRLRSVFNPCVEKLYEAYGIEKPPPHVLRRIHAAPHPD
jgi:hypothetical protein